MSDDANRYDSNDGVPRQGYDLMTVMEDSDSGWVMVVPDTDDPRIRRTMWILVDESSLIDPQEWR